MLKVETRHFDVILVMKKGYLKTAASQLAVNSFNGNMQISLPARTSLFVPFRPIAGYRESGTSSRASPGTPDSGNRRESGVKQAEPTAFGQKPIGKVINQATAYIGLAKTINQAVRSCGTGSPWVRKCVCGGICCLSRR